MSLASWIKHKLLPEPPAPSTPPAPEPTRPLVRPWQELSEEERAEQEELLKLRSQVHEESRRNKSAALSSVKVAHVAISAEERGRTMLDELMRSMDRGQ